MPFSTPTTLVTGQRAIDRETAIAARLPGTGPAGAPPSAGAPFFAGAPHPDTAPSSGTAPHPDAAQPSDTAPLPDTAAGTAPASVAVIIEGLADPNTPLPDSPGVRILRIAPGCLCCAGNVVLRVTLNRLLRRPPARLFISLADATHVGQLRAMLSAPPYDTLLSLCDDVAAPATAR